MNCGGRRSRRSEGIGLEILKGELPALGRAAFASGPGDLGVEDVRALGLQVSDCICISDGVQMHPLVPIYVPCPKWTHKKRLEGEREREREDIIALVFQQAPPLDIPSTVPVPLCLAKTSTQNP